MNESLQLPICPYCGKSLGFFETKNIQKKGEYVCTHCGCISKIDYQKKLKVVAVVSVLLPLLIVVVSVLLGDVNIWEFILSIFPFIVFFILAPYTMVLKVKDQNESEDFYKHEYEEDYNNDDVKIYKEKKRRRYSNASFNIEPTYYDDIEKTRVF